MKFFRRANGGLNPQNPPLATPLKIGILCCNPYYPFSDSNVWWEILSLGFLISSWFFIFIEWQHFLQGQHAGNMLI